MNNSSASHMLFKTFSLLNPHSPSSTLTANDFATFFRNKINTLAANFPHHNLTQTS